MYHTAINMSHLRAVFFIHHFFLGTVKNKLRTKPIIGKGVYDNQKICLFWKQSISDKE